VSTFVVNISELLEKQGAQEPLHIVESTGPIAMGAQRFSFLTPVELDVVLESIRQGIMAKGSLDIEVETVCSRCLTKVDLHLVVGLEEVFATGRKAAEELLGKEEAEEAYLITNERIDLEPAVRQAIILSLPIQPLCSEACRGLCPRCGQNLNIKKCDCKIEEIDSRMEKLKKLIEEEKDQA
jgi:uncharacterized protein